jgi:hypothetical protein
MESNEEKEGQQRGQGGIYGRRGKRRGSQRRALPDQGAAKPWGLARQDCDYTISAAEVLLAVTYCTAEYNVICWALLELPCALRSKSWEGNIGNFNFTHTCGAGCGTGLIGISCQRTERGRMVCVGPEGYLFADFGILFERQSGTHEFVHLSGASGVSAPGVECNCLEVLLSRTVIRYELELSVVFESGSTF